MAPNFFRLLLILIVAYALWRGGRDERIAALICVAGTIATLAVISPLNARFEGVELAVLGVDLAVLAGFVAIALHSNRYWPLWISGVQLTTVMGHAMKEVHSDLMPRAYAASLTFWAYWVILILAIGTWRHHRRTLHC